jgi:hypothetical protein
MSVEKGVRTEQESSILKPNYYFPRPDHSRRLHMRVPIRCCCDAHLIGSVSVAGYLLKVNNQITLCITPEVSYKFNPYAKPTDVVRHALDFRVGIAWLNMSSSYGESDWNPCLSLRSRDYDEELIERIPTFELPKEHEW